MASTNDDITVVDFCRKRGDDHEIQFAVVDKSTGLPRVITGSTFLMTVDPAPDPVDSSNNLFQMAGVITDPVNSIVTFSPTPSDVDQIPDVYFHDIQMTDSGGKKRTIGQGQFQFEQDITKN